MSWDTNILNHPEKHNLAVVAEADISEPDYSFDMIAVWADSEGFYLATDSGCSCPSPFENYEGKADLTGPLTAEQAIEEAESLRNEDGHGQYDYSSGKYSPYDDEGWAKFIAAVRNYTFKEDR